MDLQLVQKNETRTLPVPLTDEEVMLRGAELARHLDEIDACEERLKAEREEIKAEISRHTEAAMTLRGAVRSRREHREVLCEWSRNDERLTMELHRQDTGECVESRPMTAGERQEKLKLRPVGRRDDAASAES